MESAVPRDGVFFEVRSPRRKVRKKMRWMTYDEWMLVKRMQDVHESWELPIRPIDFNTRKMDLLAFLASWRENIFFYPQPLPMSLKKR